MPTSVQDMPQPQKTGTAAATASSGTVTKIQRNTISIRGLRP